MTDQELLDKVKLGLTRAQVIAILGMPDHVGGTSRKCRIPMIFKYGEVELHFEPHLDGELSLIYKEVNGEPQTLASTIREK